MSAVGAVELFVAFGASVFVVAATFFNKEAVATLLAEGLITFVAVETDSTVVITSITQTVVAIFFAALAAGSNATFTKDSIALGTLVSL